MKPKTLLVLFATIHGQSALIADRIAREATIATGIGTRVQELGDASAEDLEQCDSVVIVASVQFGRHARSVERFVKRNRGRLESLHSAFVSVSGSASRPETRPEAEMVARRFFAMTGWNPDEYELIGGALKFTQYNFLMRFMIKRINARQGRMYDGKRDYEFTDWDAVRRFARAFVGSETPRRAIA